MTTHATALNWILACSVSISVAFAATPTTQPPSGAPSATPKRPPSERGQVDVGTQNWDDLDTLAAELTKADKRDRDGDPELRNMTRGITAWLEALPAKDDVKMAEQIGHYRIIKPDSRMGPIVEAMHQHVTAWRARGRGFNNTVTPEGRALFDERNARAWTLITQARPQSDSLPSWYEQALAIGADADAEPKTLRAILEEGVRRFPGYFPLYAIALREHAPRWGGSYEDADRYIRKAVSSKSNTAGDELYTRLYSELDYRYDGGQQTFFTASKVSWTKKAGFQLMVKRYPASPQTRADFAIDACRAGDGDTFLQLRKSIDSELFDKSTPEGITLDVCVARFSRAT